MAKAWEEAGPCILKVSLQDVWTAKSNANHSRGPSEKHLNQVTKASITHDRTDCHRGFSRRYMTKTHLSVKEAWSHSRHMKESHESKWETLERITYQKLSRSLTRAPRTRKDWESAPCYRRPKGSDSSAQYRNQCRKGSFMVKIV